MNEVTTIRKDEDGLVVVGNDDKGVATESMRAWLCDLELVCDGDVVIHWAITPDQWFANHPSVQYV
jgi:hypothetical protein